MANPFQSILTAFVDLYSKWMVCLRLKSFLVLNLSLNNYITKYVLHSALPKIYLKERNYNWKLEVKLKV